MRMLGTILVGILIGALSVLAYLEASGGWYEYVAASSKLEATGLVNGHDGWHVAPHQTDPLHLRRVRGIGR